MDYASPLNCRTACPNGCYTTLEDSLLRLRLVSEVNPRQQERRERKKGSGSEGRDQGQGSFEALGKSLNGGCKRTRSSDSAVSSYPDKSSTMAPTSSSYSTSFTTSSQPLIGASINGLNAKSVKFAVNSGEKETLSCPPLLPLSTGKPLLQPSLPSKIPLPPPVTSHLP